MLIKSTKSELLEVLQIISIQDWLIKFPCRYLKQLTFQLPGNDPINNKTVSKVYDYILKSVSGLYNRIVQNCNRLNLNSVKKLKVISLSQIVEYQTFFLQFHDKSRKQI